MSTKRNKKKCARKKKYVPKCISTHLESYERLFFQKKHSAKTLIKKKKKKKKKISDCAETLGYGKGGQKKTKLLLAFF